MLIGRLVALDYIEALVTEFAVPKGLRPAIGAHRHTWLKVLRSGKTGRVEDALKNPAVRSWIRGRFIEDFGRLVAVVHQGGVEIALTVEASRGTLSADRVRTIREIHSWLCDEGHRLEHLRVDLAKRGSEAQRRAFLQGLYESVDDLVVFQPVSKEDAREAVHRVTTAYRGAKRARFDSDVRAARAKRRARTGEAMPSLRSHGPMSFSIQEFRKSELFNLLGPFFRPVVPVRFQTGRRLSETEWLRLRQASERARDWFSRPLKAKVPRVLLKQGTPPAAAIEFSQALRAELRRLLPDARDRVALRAVLTVVASQMDYRALPLSLGVGSGVAALRRIRRQQASPNWGQIVSVLRADPVLGRLDLERLEHRRPYRSRRRRAG